MNQHYFITSTGTGIGKSFITSALVRQAKAAGRSVAAYKPVISGFDPNDRADSDTGLILQSLGETCNAEAIDRISPFRYRAPLAPSMAARLENRPLDFNAVVRHSQQALQGPEEMIVIEGVGGIMVPLNDRRLVVDWVEALGIPVLLVVGTYLGSISHTLTALSVLRQRHIPLHAIIVNESEEASVSLDATINELNIWTQVPLVSVKRCQAGKQPDIIRIPPDIL